MARVKKSISVTDQLEWLEGWYNPHRRHSGLGYLSPINYERKMLQVAA